MELYFIRHGKTAGNLEKRYIGVTDEPLCGAGRLELETRRYPAARAVVASPLRRCLETASIIYPDKTPLLCRGLRECDFGAFEGKNYDDLNGAPVYQQWIDSGGKMAFPGGEDMAGFCARTASAFEELVPSLADKTAFVVHGGTIMALLERYALPQREFYDYRTENGGGYIVDFDGGVMSVIGRLG